MGSHLKQPFSSTASQPIKDQVGGRPKIECCWGNSKQADLGPCAAVQIHVAKNSPRRLGRRTAAAYIKLQTFPKLLCCFLTLVDKLCIPQYFIGLKPQRFVKMSLFHHPILQRPENNAHLAVSYRYSPSII